MRLLRALALLLLSPIAAQAVAVSSNTYFIGPSISTTTGKARYGMAGLFTISASSRTSSTFTIQMDGATGNIISSGSITALRSSITASAFFGDGSGLTGLLATSTQVAAGALLGGPLASSILPSTVAYTNRDNAFTVPQTLQLAVGVDSSLLPSTVAYTSNANTFSTVQTISLNAATFGLSIVNTNVAGNGLSIKSAADGVSSFFIRNAANTVEHAFYGSGRVDLDLAGSNGGVNIGGNGFTVGTSTFVVSAGRIGVGTTSPSALVNTVGGNVAVSSSATSATSFSIKGAYTSTQLSTLSASAGEVVWNTTLNQVCGSSATLASALPGAWCLPRSTSTTANLIPCY